MIARTLLVSAIWAMAGLVAARGQTSVPQAMPPFPQPIPTVHLPAAPTIDLPHPRTVAEPRPSGAAPTPPASLSSTNACLPSTDVGLVECGTPACEPVCGPRIRATCPRPTRVICPTPQVVYITTKERKVVEAARCSPEKPTCTVGCTAPAPTGPGIGSSPQAPGTTTIHVPYTQWVPVPTYAVVPHSASWAVGYGGTQIGFGSAGGMSAFPGAGFGVMQVGGGFGSGPGFGTGAGSGQTTVGSVNITGSDLAALRLAMSVIRTGKEQGFGNMRTTDESCKKELSELAVRVEKLRAELDGVRKSTDEHNLHILESVRSSETNQAKVVAALQEVVVRLNQQSIQLNQLEKRVGTLPDNDKPFADVIRKLQQDVKDLGADRGKGNP